MTALALILLTTMVFALLLALETIGDPTQPRLKQYGLVVWLVSGNWPAKVGAGLLMLGVGALIRFVLLHVDIPPGVELGGGIAIAGALGAISFWLRARPARRALHLAFAGAALGTAYLVAYSAYAVFGYLNDMESLALLVLVSVVGGMFAIQSRAPSVAVLAMSGAFAAPAFAIGHPQPLTVNSYYLAVSALSFLMVWQKGWRPLIHLSFLFTLAGTLFFGWTQGFYQPANYGTLQPFLFALVGIHLLMPLAEKRASRGKWVHRLDVGYFIALPVVATAMTLRIAPDLRLEGALGIAGLALMWGTVGVVLHTIKRAEAAIHLAMAILLAVFATLLFVRDIPWSLVVLVSLAMVLAVGPRFQLSKTMLEFCARAMLWVVAIHVVVSLGTPRIGAAFLNPWFAERMVVVLALAWAVFSSRRAGLSLTGMLAAVATGWGLLALGAELGRLNFEYLPQAIHGALVMFALGICVWYAARTLPAWFMNLLSIGIVSTAWWAAVRAPASLAIMLALLGPLALILLGRGGYHRRDGDEVPGILAISGLTFLVIPWAMRLQAIYGIESVYFGLTLSVGSVLSSILLGRAFRWVSEVWWRGVLPFVFWTLTVLAAGNLLFHIVREFWAIGFDLLTLVTLFVITQADAETATPAAKGVALIVLVALFIQAMLLRMFGTGDLLTVGDLAHMRLPSVVSLMWAMIGAGLCWWATRIQVRGAWLLGATLLAISAAKSILFDFSSLGELGNIIALILSGLVFLCVAWLAPFPPKKGRQSTQAAAPTLGNGDEYPREA